MSEATNPTPAAAERPLRSDARRNRERILEAALQNALMHTAAIRRHAGEERRTLEDLVARIVQRAQEAGELRPDFTTDDIPMLMCGVSSTMGEHFDWRRHLELVLDGLRVRS